MTTITSQYKMNENITDWVGLFAGVLSSRRHKLFKLSGDQQIFRRCLLFDIGRSLADFLDLEPCRKSHASDACRPLLGDCSATALFVLQVTKFPADAPPVSRRRLAGTPAVTPGTSIGRRRTTINPTIIGKSPFGHRAAIYGFATGEILKLTFNFCMFIVIVNNFYY